MMQVTVKTLRHYEQKGLLLPDEVDEWTGQRLGCKCPPPGYCFTVEHDKEYKPVDVDIEYCEQVEEMGQDSAIIQFKRLPAIPKALCMKHVGPYERFYESFIELFRYIWKNKATKPSGSIAPVTSTDPGTKKPPRNGSPLFRYQ